MDSLYQTGATLAFIVVLLVAAGCSASAEPQSVLVETQPTVAPSPTQTEAPPVATSAPAPTPAPAPTLEPEPTVSSSPTVAAEPTVVAEPTATGPATVQAQPSENGEPLNRGLLAEQFCVVDIVAPDTLNVRAGPSTDHDIVDMLSEGECRIYLAEGQADGWLEIFVDRDDGPVRGWVSAKFIAALRAPVDPTAPTVVITISVEYEIGDPESEAAIETFQLVDSQGLVIDFLDSNGQIEVPASLDLTSVRVTAEFANDRFCAWTGTLRPAEAADRYVVNPGALCA